MYPRQYLESQTDFTLLSSLSGPTAYPSYPHQYLESQTDFTLRSPSPAPLPIPFTPENI